MPARLLAAIPHYVRPAGDGAHGSLREGAVRRGAALSRTIAALRNTLGPAALNDWSEPAHRTLPANDATACTIDVAVLTVAGMTGFDHLEIDRAGFTEVACAVPPMLLGFEARRVFREARGRYDWYAYLEDDLEILDPWFLHKLDRFVAAAGTGAVLLPQRYEESACDPRGRLYVDGILPAAMLRSLEPRAAGDGPVALDHLGQRVLCEPARNPHAGCHVLRADQLERWIASPWYDDRDTGFAGPLESAATLALARCFAVYKAVPSQAGFLEIRHAGTAQINTARAPSPVPPDAPPAHRLGLLLAEAEHQARRVAHLEGELANREAQLRGIFASRLWRAMEPMRRLAAIVKAAGRR